MSTYIVTGAAGFIGSRVSQQLMEAGHGVVGIDNLNDAYDVRVKYYRLEKLKTNPLFLFYKLDISDRNAVMGLLNQPELAGAQMPAVIHLAARAGVRQAVENPWIYVDSNVTGSLNMLELARQAGIGKFVMASTSSIYGANPPLPTPETADSDHPLQPYAASKKGAEALCHSYHHLFGLDVTIVRYFTVYGPAGRPDMVMFRLAKWITEGQKVSITGDGTQSRGFTYLDDIARGTILATKPLGYEIINLGGHETISMNDLLHLLEDLIGRKAEVEYIPRHPADVMENYAAVDKARRMLGWEPQVSLHDGVQALVNWYQTERSWAQHILTP